MTYWIIITAIQGAIFFAMGTRCGMKMTAKHCARLTEIQINTFMAYVKRKGLIDDFNLFLDSEHRRLDRKLATLKRRA